MVSDDYAMSWKELTDNDALISAKAGHIFDLEFVPGMPLLYAGTGKGVYVQDVSLGAGATSIGNLGQYFTFRQPEWDDDVTTTAETVKALALIASQPQSIIVHSNLDDGFAATFRDAACAFGALARGHGF